MASGNPTEQLQFGEGPREIFAGSIAALLGTLVMVGMLVRGIGDLLDPTVDKVESLKSLPGVAIGLLFAYIGYWLLLWTDQIAFDPAQRSYRRRRGWGPWAQVQAGNFSALDCIRLRLGRARENGHFWRATLHWKKPGIKHPIFDLPSFPDPAQAKAEAHRLGAVLGIVVDDSAVETYLLKERKQEAWSRRLYPYKVGLVIVACVLALNALVSGIHWKDSWTDERGRVFERWSTLFHTLTRVRIGGRTLGYTDRKWYVIGDSRHNTGIFANQDLPMPKALNYQWSLGFGPFPSPERSKNAKQ